jgi:aldehyde dehydrogenase (NAD+)
MWGEHPNGSPEMGKVITDWHCDRIKKLIDTSGGEIICGGRVDRDIKYVEPTVIVDPKPTSSIMEEEIFGPVLPIITFNNIDEVIELINKKEKPLAVYYFGKVLFNKNKDRLLNETSSGAFVQNEAIMHILSHEMGFGGVGPSGYGRYSGYEGFKQFSNPKSVLIKPTTNFYPFT